MSLNLYVKNSESSRRLSEEYGYPVTDFRRDCGFVNFSSGTYIHIFDDILHFDLKLYAHEEFPVQEVDRALRAVQSLYNGSEMEPWLNSVRSLVDCALNRGEEFLYVV